MLWLCITILTLLLNIKKLFQSQIFFNLSMSPIKIYPSFLLQPPYHPAPRIFVQPYTSRCQNPMVCQTLRGRGRAPSPSQKSKTINVRPILKPPIDLGNGPYDLAQNLHTASSSDSKNFSLLSFCPENFFCWLIDNFRCRKWRFFENFFFKSPYLAPRCSERVACGRRYC